MLLPIDTIPLRFLLTGEPVQVLDYESRMPRTDSAGRPLLEVPVVVTGTGDKRAPAVEITVPGPLPDIEQGSFITFTGLMLRTWSVRGSDGRERNGVSLRAEAMDLA
jgi:hypothetical protein